MVLSHYPVFVYIYVLGTKKMGRAKKQKPLLDPLIYSNFHIMGYNYGICDLCPIILWAPLLVSQYLTFCMDLLYVFGCYSSVSITVLLKNPAQKHIDHDYVYNVLILPSTVSCRCSQSDYVLVCVLACWYQKRSKIKWFLAADNFDPIEKIARTYYF